MKNETQILNGKFSTALLDKSKYEAQIDDIIKLSVKNIYQSEEVIDKEIAGYEVITQLLDTFIIAVNNKYNGKPSSYDKLILKLLPGTIKTEESELYSRVLNICHYVSLLSDSHAVLTYKKLRGFQFN
jgi:dGTPase